MAGNGNVEVKGFNKLRAVKDFFVSGNFQVSPSIYETQEPLSLTIDPVNGKDVDSSLIFSTQNQLNTYGSFATISGALKVLPQRIKNEVKLTHVDGEYVVKSDYFGDLSRFSFVGSGTLNAVGGNVFITSQEILTRIAGTSQMSASSATATTVTLSGADPGFAIDQFQGTFLRIISGTGATTTLNNNVYPIRTHSGTLFTIAGSWNSNPDNTSIIEIAKPSLRFVVQDFLVWRMPFVSSNGSLDKMLILSGTEFQCSGNSGFGDISSRGLRLSNGNVLMNICKISKTNFIINNTTAFTNNLIVSGSPNAGITVNGGFLRPANILISDTLKTGITLQGNSVNNGSGLLPSQVFLLATAIDRAVSFPVLAQGQGSYMDVNLSVTGSTTTATHFLAFVSGAQGVFRVNSTGTLPTGSSGEILIDGVSVLYSDLAKDDYRSISGPKGSMLTMGL